MNDTVSSVDASPTDARAPQAATGGRRPVNIAVVWHAFGPQHVDRVNALVGHFDSVTGIPIFAASHEYDWSWAPEMKFDAVTLCAKRGAYALDCVRIVAAMLGLRFRKNVNTWLMCHYEDVYIFVASWLLRFTGARVFIMQDSKFDDYQRHLWREALKSFLYSPFQGAIAASERTASYLRFLGVKGPIGGGYNTGSTERLRSYRPKTEPAFADRPFLFVGRMIEKKNLLMLLEAYAAYVTAAGSRARRLKIVGDGPEGEKARALIAKLGIGHLVSIDPWLEQPKVIEIMCGAAYLLVPSTSEQFGNVIGEAATVGLPAIVSDNAGARELLSTSFVSGFSLPAQDKEAWTQAMLDLTDDEPLWLRLRDACQVRAAAWDSARFRESAELLAYGSTDKATA